MKRSLVALAALAFTATAASAQDMMTAARPVTFGISAGVAIPTGDFGKAVKTGYQVAGHLGFIPAMLPVGLRFDGTWGQNDSDMTNPKVTSKIWSVAGNAILQVPGMMMASPYLLGGLGYYNLGSNVSGAKSEGGIGFQAGVGTKFHLAGFATFAEAKWTTFQVGDGADKARINVIPITFGIMF